MVSHKTRPDVKLIVGFNVRSLMQARRQDFDSACKAMKMKPTQLKRIVSGKHAITMTTLERIAGAYDLEPYQLLIPGLDAKNPQVLRALSPADENLYRALEEARRGADQ